MNRRYSERTLKGYSKRLELLAKHYNPHGSDMLKKISEKVNLNVIG